MTRVEKSYNAYKRMYMEKSAKNPDMYYEMLDFAEYSQDYTLASRAKMKNIARTLTTNQRKWSYNFQRKWEKWAQENSDGDTITKLTGNETAEERRNVFLVFAQNYDDLDIAREEFEKKFY